MPKHAPYEIQPDEVGAEVEIRVFGDGEDTLTAECEYRGDKFGAQTTLAGSDLERILAVDELVQGVANLVWNELLGTPVFREEDEEWVERVSSRAAWLGNERKPTQGWIHSASLPEPVSEPERPRDDLHSALGDADIGELSLTQAEIESVARGEIPDSLRMRVMAARSTENLLDSVANVLERVDETSDHHAIGEIVRARIEIAEVQRRFGSS